MAGPANNRDFKLYNIGWIAALSHELAAARSMRDENHGRPHNFQKNPSDHNSYDWGRIGEHYVVFASLPTAGIGAAAAAATAMITSFPHLRCVLMVGIGGGIPSKRDIRLGDVVVSHPDETSSGVEQYDLGARRSGGTFVRKGHLNQPPTFIISAIRSLQANHETQKPKVPDIVRDLLKNNSYMAPKYSHPGIEKDQLFVPSAIQVESEEEVHRAERPSTDPEIHYGIIASGNSVIKDGIERDRIVEDVGEECLCFEMEAAGLMNNMPCVVIRGICDYSDAHKNDDWQRYAALTAAAYTKELLGEIDPVEVTGSSEVQELLKADKMEEILKWLSDDNQNAVHRGHLSMFLKGTCQEFFGSPKFDSWLCGKAKTLFCPGSPGTGKSTIAAAVIDHLNAFEHKVAFYYWSYIQQDPHPVDTFVRSILRQLIQGLDSFPSDLDILYRQEKKKHPPKMASSDDFRNLFTKVLPETETLYIVVDALDECDRHYSELMRILREMQSKRDIRVLATSRPLQGISGLFEGYLELPVVAQNNDLGSYLKEKCPSSNIFQESPHLWGKVTDVIIERVNGVFLLARLYAGSVNDIRCEADIEKFRESMGPTSTSDERLAQLYNKSLDRIEGLTERDCARAQKVMVWVAYAQGPLTSEALQYALAFNAGDGADYKLWLDLLDSGHLLRGTDRYVCYQSVLQLAASRGHVATVKALVEYGKRAFPRVEFFKQNLKPALSVALSVGSAPIAEVLLKSGADASKEDLKEVLLKVISAGSLPGIKLLLDHGAFHENALVAAARSGSVTVMNLLLDRGIDEKCGKYDESALWAAIDRGDREMVKLLLDKGPDGERGHALEQAANLGSQEIVRLLLERGVDVKHGSGGSALVRAADRGSQEIVRLLLERGVDVKHGSGGEALVRAAGRGSQEIVRLLLDEGSDVDFDDGGSHNAALAEAVCMKEYEMVKLLLDEGANINHGGRDGTALKIAANEGSWEMVSLLLDGALFEASRNGHSDIVTLLLSNGASLEDGALHIAAMYGHIDIMAALLDKGADINATAESKVVDGLCGTPLYHAQFGWAYNLEAIRFLLARDANDTIPGSIAFKRGDSQNNAIHVRSVLDTNGCDSRRKLSALKSVLLSGVQQGMWDLENHPTAQHAPQASVSVVTLMDNTKEIIARYPNLGSQEALERNTAQLLYAATDAAVDLLGRYHAEYTPEATAAFGTSLEQIKDLPKRLGYGDEIHLGKKYEYIVISLLRNVADDMKYHIRHFTCREGTTTEVTVEFARIVQKIKDLEVLVFEATVLRACTAE
ncbi:lipase [Apiospora arundinis]